MTEELGLLLIFRFVYEPLHYSFSYCVHCFMTVCDLFKTRNSHETLPLINEISTIVLAFEFRDSNANTGLTRAGCLVLRIVHKGLIIPCHIKFSLVYTVIFTAMTITAFNWKW